jgi:hypothetical protein
MRCWSTPRRAACADRPLGHVPGARPDAGTPVTNPHILPQTKTAGSPAGSVERSTNVHEPLTIISDPKYSVFREICASDASATRSLRAPSSAAWILPRWRPSWDMPICEASENTCIFPGNKWVWAWRGTRPRRFCPVLDRFRPGKPGKSGFGREFPGRFSEWTGSVESTPNRVFCWRRGSESNRCIKVLQTLYICIELFILKRYSRELYPYGSHFGQLSGKLRLRPTMPAVGDLCPISGCEFESDSGSQISIPTKFSSPVVQAGAIGARPRSRRHIPNNRIGLREAAVL